jgi:hypothetical protein
LNAKVEIIAWEAWLTLFMNFLAGFPQQSHARHQLVLNNFFQLPLIRELPLRYPTRSSHLPQTEIVDAIPQSNIT